MDIFTTVLTRVVPVPIKPANLKVKALEKKAPTSGVSDDIAGLEEPAPYFKKPIADHDKNNEENLKENADNEVAEIIEASPVPADNTGQHIDVFDDNDHTPEEKDDKPHLDLFV